MTCSRCQTINPQGAVACAACGAPLVAMPMMQQPGYMPHGQPYVVMQPMAPVRSGIPKTMGILMIVFSSIGLLASLATLGSDPLAGSLIDSDARSSFKTMIVVIGVMDLGIGGLHMFAGIRSVGYKQNGPQLAIAYAIARIVATVVAVIMVYVWVKPLLDAFPALRSAVMGQLVATAVIGAIWPIIVLALMTRPAAKAACNG